MTKTNNKQIKQAYKRYQKSNLYTLYDCYSSYSYYKERAFNYCRALQAKYEGRQGRILGYNCMAFSYGFIGVINGKDAFFYITKDHDRFIYLYELMD